MLQGDQHYRRPALCRVPSGLSSVVFRALGKDAFAERFFDTRQRSFFAECFFLTLGKEALCRVFFLHSAKKISKHILK